MNEQVAGETLLTFGTEAPRGVGMLPAGAIVAGYRIEGRAGAGGMGVVYRATDLELDRTVALKVIAPEFARDERFRTLFREESRKAASLEHPNVIPIYRSGEDGDQLFIAMRFVEGPSLQELIDQRGRLPVGAAVRIVSQIADALDAAHAIGLVHRDVKPGNVLVTYRGGEEHALLSDFGLSLPIAQAGRMVGERYVGTPAYLSPEQIRGGQLDVRADVYALGCVLFHLLTGQVPFPAPGFESKIVAHLTSPPPSVTSLVPDLPRQLDELIRCALAKRPEERFSSAGDLAAAARAARSDVVVCAHPGDEEAASAVADRLKAHDLDVRHGGDGAGVDLRSARACLLVVGRRGVDWAAGAIAEGTAVQTADPRFLFMPVLIPGAPEPIDRTLAPLTSRRFVDLRDGLDSTHVASDLLRALEVGSATGASPERRGECPYRGLEAFQEDDAELFFGRRTETELMRAKLVSSRFLAVLGASGSGKSSLVRAGLIPTLRATRSIEVVVITPGAAPLSALAARVHAMEGASAAREEEFLADTRTLDHVASRIGSRPDRPELVVVVDQFEETFSLASNAMERQAFIDNLVYAATIPGGNATIVLAMRSDFYHRCAEHLALRSLIAEEQFLVGPLGPDGLRQAIEEPARLAGLELEPGLTRRIVADVSDEPGALPLVEHLLTELWERRRGGLMTLEAYADAGGVGGALSQHAEVTYAGLGTKQSSARRILLRLTQPGEGTEDTRRRALVKELVIDEDDADTRPVIDELVAARLLVLTTDVVSGDPAVEVAHEAIIRGWPRLRGWVDGDREQLRLHRRLTEAVADWTAAGQDDGALLRGSRLALWQDRSLELLNERERAFLEASRLRAERDQVAKQRRRRVLGGVAAATAVLLASAGGVAITQSRNANDERAASQSRRLADDSDVTRPADPELAVLLAQEAQSVATTPEAEESLRQAVAESRVRGAVPDQGAVIVSLADLGRGKVLFTGEDNKIREWDSLGDRRGARVSTRDAGPSGTNSVVVTPKGYLTAGAGGTIALWQPGNDVPRVLGNPGGDVWELRQLSGGESILSVGTTGVWRWRLDGGDGRRVLAGSFLSAVPLDDSDRAFAVWDENLNFVHVRNGELRQLGSARSLEISPDRRFVAVGRDDALEIWANNGTTLTRVSRRPAPDGVNGIAFNRSGNLVAIAGGNAAVTVWPAVSGAPLTQLRGHSGPVAAVRFLSGNRIVSAGTDRTVRLWEWTHGVPANIAAPKLIPSGAVRFAGGRGTMVDTTGASWTWTASDGLRQELPAIGAGVFSAGISADGRLVGIGLEDGQVIVRDQTNRVVAKAKAPDIPITVAFDRTGRRVVVSVLDGSVVEFPLTTPKALRTVAKRDTSALVAAYSPTADVIASGFRDGAVTLSRGADTEQLGSHDGPIFNLAFSDDGTKLATTSGDRTVRIWDVTAKRLVRTLRGHRGQVWDARFAGDGRLVSAGDDGLRFWDLSGGTRQWVMPVQNGVTEIAVEGDGPTVLFAGRDPGAAVSTCDVCGSLEDVEKLVPQRTTRDLTPAERAGESR